jgi:hypothetical protein
MNDLLRELAETDQELEAPLAVEMRLRAAFRRRYARRTWPYFAAAAAAGLALTLFVRPKPPETMEISVAAPPVVNVPVASPVPGKIVHLKQPKEVTTEFYSLMDAPPPFDRGELLRVSLPASAMRSVGLPVREDRLDEMVQADVLVGEEGLARAIRFVRFEY